MLDVGTLGQQFLGWVVAFVASLIYCQRVLLFSSSISCLEFTFLSFPGLLWRSWLPPGVDEAFLENCHHIKILATFIPADIMAREANAMQWWHCTLKHIFFLQTFRRYMCVLKYNAQCRGGIVLEHTLYIFSVNIHHGSWCDLRWAHF